jgi:hypothetical protein
LSTKSCLAKCPNSSSEQKSLRAWLPSILSKSCADVFGWFWDVLEIFTFFLFFCHVLVATAEFFRRLLDQIRTENALPGADRPVPCSLLQDVRAKLRTAAGFQTAFVQGSSSRGTSVDDMGGLVPWR